ncbi:uncharacterized protein Dwil_GK15248 [Drosophila willistoni]|uniref:Tubulin polyglutamylase TTLL4 n=2 Tax=Drosophila willistoni TaxID=7260 RepID=B4MU99_DROWI|nr:uncharacterized protein Dwil_GK15248 [Drosophila willistoni]
MEPTESICITKAFITNQRYYSARYSDSFITLSDHNHPHYHHQRRQGGGGGTGGVTNRSSDFAYQKQQQQQQQQQHNCRPEQYFSEHNKLRHNHNHHHHHHHHDDTSKEKTSRQTRRSGTTGAPNYLDESLAYVNLNSSQHSTLLEPTWESILTERQSQYRSSDQHYAHYFSYFYNRGPRKTSKCISTTTTGRPGGAKLAMSSYSELPTSRHNNADNNDDDDDDGQEQTSTGRRNQLLKNDNPPATTQQQQQQYDSGWPPNNDEYTKYDPVLVKETEDYLDIKDIYDNEQIIDARFDPVQRRYCKLATENNPEDAGDAAVFANNNNNNNNNINSELKQRSQKQTSCNPSRLPLTPKRSKGGAAQSTSASTATATKKQLPTVHRVLLYNSQSPRLSRKPQSVLRSLGQKQHKNSKAHVNAGDAVPTVILVEPESKDNSHNHGRIEFDRNDDFDEDDDLDDISNFDESDTASVCSDTEDGYRAHAYKMTHSSERFLSTHTTSTGSSILTSQSSEDDLKNPESLLVPSLFPYVPPYLAFSSNTKKGPKVPAELHRVLKWRVTNIMPKVVRLILANSGMRMLKKTNDWMGVWGKHLKSPCFKTIRSYQKINHLPGSFRIGRKDSCWKNLERQMHRHSNKEFGFMPRTYIIPNDLCSLRRHWPRYAQRNTKWIIKPPASARGAGIRVINRWGQIPKRRPLIVQKYIERPLLINGSKFDLRLYVLVTSVNPLRVFMYHNGLARFASVKYSSKADTLNDRCMHLTNYSINKFSSNYSKNEDVNACHGHKWTIKCLWTYLANRGVRTDCLWEALRSLVLRTLFAGENGINNMIRANVESKYSCFELFGFDVILDSDLVPWLLEVNISPSLHSELPLDAHVKAPLVQGVLNTALYNVPPKLTQEKQKELAAEFSFPPGTQMCYDKRLYINYLSREEKVKHNTFTRKSMEDREEYIDAILQNLTPDDVRCLIIAEDELARCAPLERIFPTDQTYKYLKYNDIPRYYNRLLDAWESRYANNRTEGIALLRDYCQNKYHLQVPAPPAKKDWSVKDEFILKPEEAPARDVLVDA